MNIIEKISIQLKCTVAASQQRISRTSIGLHRISFVIGQLAILWIVLSIRMNAFQLIHPNSNVYWAPISVNNITAWYSSDGRHESFEGVFNLNGLSYPRNTVSTIYTSSFLYTATFSNNGHPIRIAHGPYYSSTLQQGSILGTLTGNAENKSDPSVRLWRIRKNFATADLRRDASDTYNIEEKLVSIMDMQRLRAQYKLDWTEWPAAKGAPYVDVNNNGFYDPKFIRNQFGVEIPDTASDVPGIAGADQVIWYVVNDLGANSLWNSPPMGVEQQFTIWAYQSTEGALGNTVFRRCRLIYKGTALSSPTDSLIDMYLGVWSDIDLGQFNDNFAGSDSLLGLGYIYNSKTMDSEYSRYNMSPPSVGFDVLQTPVIKSTSLDSALKNFSYRRSYKNIPVSSIIYTGSYNPFFSLGANGLNSLDNVLKGYRSTSGLLRTNPITNQPTKFWASGDPQTRNGWVDGTGETAGTRSLILSSGPFSMAIGDTQEIVTALIIAQTKERLAGIGLLKYYDRQIQERFAQLMTSPVTIPATGATATALDKKILLEWEKDTAALNRVEKFSSQGYLFEGYNVYQLPAPNAPRSGWKKIFVYDLKDEYTQIMQEEYNQSTGNVENTIVQHGSNSGIQRYLILTGDSLRKMPLVNGLEYYFAVSAYAVLTSNSGQLKKAIESDPQIFTVSPHQPNPGSLLPYSLNDSIPNSAESYIGDNDSRIGIKILDPYSVTGGTYDIWYGKNGANMNWTVVKNIAGTDYATISARLSASELPTPRPNPLPNGTGTAQFTINDAKDRISYSITISTSRVVTAVDIYTGYRLQHGGVVKTLPLSGNVITGVWTKNDAAQPLTDELIKDFTSGILYVLVKTTTYPNGEMRGQLFDGMVPRTNLPEADASTSSRSVFSFTEHRLPNEGFSMFVSPSSVGVKSGLQISPSEGNIINQPNYEGTYFLVGPGYSWVGYKHYESVIEFRFTNDTNWAITTAKTPAEAKFIRVPFQVFQDSVRVWPLVNNAITTDSVWNTKGNAFLNGASLFDKITAIINSKDYSGNDISYYTTMAGGLPTSLSLKSRLMNGVNYITQNITFANPRGTDTPPQAGTVIRLTPYKSIHRGDMKRMVMRSIEKNVVSAAKEEVKKINVFPNPYYGVNNFELSQDQRYVTFTHLPEKATLRIFNLGGIHVKTLKKNDPGQFFRWDLRNEKGYFVASGLYIVYIDLEEVGTTILKLAVIMEEQNINSF